METELGRCGYNWVTEDSEIGFPLSEDTGHNGTPCNVQPADR
jgi:hypothetical protein